MNRLALALFMSILAAGSPEKDYVLMLGHRHGRLYEAKVSCQSLRQTPAWKKVELNPPLSARTAIELASQSLRDEVTSGGWSFDTLFMQRACGDDEHWYYVVSFSSPLPGLRSGILVYVLMDGRVVELRPRKDSADR